MDSGGSIETFCPQTMAEMVGQVSRGKHGATAGCDVGEGAFHDAIKLWSARGSELEDDRPGGFDAEFTKLEMFRGVVTTNMLDANTGNDLQFL